MAVKQEGTSCTNHETKPFSHSAGASLWTRMSKKPKEIVRNLTHSVQFCAKKENLTIKFVHINSSGNASPLAEKGVNITDFRVFPENGTHARGAIYSEYL